MTNDDLADLLIRHQVLAEGYKRQQNDNMLLFLPVLWSIIKREVEALGVMRLSEMPTRRFDKFVSDLTEKLRKEHVQFNKRLTDALNDLSMLEAQKLKLDDFSPKEVWERPMGSDGSIPAVFIAGWFLTFLSRLQNTFRKAYIENTPNTALLQAIRGSRPNRYRDGLLGGQTARSITLTVNTSIQHFLSATQLNLFKDSKYRWVSILDNRTSAICRALDGRVFAYGAGPIPPAHPNCRSVIVPASYERKETYYQWLARHPASFQDDVLGKQRGELFRSGDLSPTEFAALQLDKNFRPRTLEELRRLLPSV